jgi:hypothetical protein
MGDNFHSSGQKKFQFVKERPKQINVEEVLDMILQGDIEEFKQFVVRNPSAINLQDRQNGNVALHIAVSRGDLGLTTFLLRSGANPNIQDSFGNSSLHYAADKGKTAAMELLLQNGANPNAQDFRGNTPLHNACANNDVEAVKMLIKWNADPELTDFGDALPRDKTRSPMIKGLIDRRIHSIHGGDTEKATQSMNWMSFGVGLGVGIGVALAQYQQQSNEMLMLKLQEAGKLKRRGNFGSVAGGSSKHEDMSIQQNDQLVPISSRDNARKFL